MSRIPAPSGNNGSSSGRPPTLYRTAPSTEVATPPVSSYPSQTHQPLWPPAPAGNARSPAVPHNRGRLAPVQSSMMPFSPNQSNVPLPEPSHPYSGSGRSYGIAGQSTFRVARPLPPSNNTITLPSMSMLSQNTAGQADPPGPIKLAAMDRRQGIHCARCENTKSLDQFDLEKSKRPCKPCNTEAAARAAHAARQPMYKELKRKREARDQAWPETGGSSSSAPPSD